MLMLVPLVLAAQSGIVIGVGSRASALQVAEVGKPGSGMPKDTFLVMLTDVIAPRYLQAKSNESLRFAYDAMLGEQIAIEPVKPSEDVQKLGDEEEVTAYGRVRLGKKWFHEELLRAGWAWVVPAKRSDAALMKLEAEAKAAKRGLWADVDPVEPWLWREVTFLGDVEGKVFHGGWECPHVKATQCAKCGGLRFYSLAEATRAGFKPHEECMNAELLRIAQGSGGYGVDPEAAEGEPRGEGPPKLAAAERRACKADAECALTPTTPCTCPGCGSVWRQAARKEVVARMKKNFAQANCGGVGCPACAGREVGTKAVCREGQCTPAP
ncbi:MAG: thermonuclease family protein [Archangium sp.]|nr:thermonuclease family protein [Archangium sp.]